MKKVATGVVLSAAMVSSVQANLLEFIFPPSVGTQIYKGAKKHNPSLGQIEYWISGGVRHVFKELSVEAGWGTLAALIGVSREDALRAGTLPIPAHIKAQMKGHFSDEILDGVRYRVGLGHDLLLPSRSFDWGNAAAITLIDVIVFKDLLQSHMNVHLWAHELAHVEQYREMGLTDFAKRYIRDYGDIEAMAESRAVSVMKDLARTAGETKPRVVKRSGGGSRRGYFAERHIERFIE